MKMLYKLSLCIITRLKIFKVSWATNIELIKFPIPTEWVKRQVQNSRCYQCRPPLINIFLSSQYFLHFCPTYIISVFPYQYSFALKRDCGYYSGMHNLHFDEEENCITRCYKVRISAKTSSCLSVLLGHL